MILVNIFVVLVVVGILLYLVNLIPMIDATIKQMIHGAAVTVVILWLIAVLFGVAAVPNLLGHLF